MTTTDALAILGLDYPPTASDIGAIIRADGHPDLDDDAEMERIDRAAVHLDVCIDLDDVGDLVLVALGGAS
jgi:hypothetical protein